MGFTHAIENAVTVGSNEQGEYCRAALQRSDRKEPRYKWPTLLFTLLLLPLSLPLFSLLLLSLPLLPLFLPSPPLRSRSP